MNYKIDLEDASFPSTARASWSAHEVGFPPQVLPKSFAAISSALMPSQSFAIAFRLPLHPPVKRIFLILSPSRVNWIVVAQTPLVLKVSSIINSLQVCLLSSSTVREGIHFLINIECLGAERDDLAISSCFYRL